MHTARFTVITPECVRMEYSPSGGGGVREWGFTDAPSLVAVGRGGGGWGGEHRVHAVRADDPEQVIDTGRIRISYRPDGGSFSAGNLEAAVLHSDGRHIRWRPGDRQTGNLGGTLTTLDGVRGRVGLGEGVLSRDGWYLLDDSGSHLLVDGWAAARPRPGDATDWYFFGYGSDYQAALRALTTLGGRVPMPRRYALGSWYSRYWPYASREFRQVVEEYDRRGLPLDVLVLDMDWHRGGWTGWSWNRELLPDAEELLVWLHQRGVHVTLNLHPADGVGPHEDQYGAFMGAIGHDPASGATVPFDAGDRRYMEALFRCVHEPLERSAGGGGRAGEGGGGGGGVDFWWLDWQQERFTRSVEGLDNLRWLNHLYFEHTGKQREADGRERRGISFSRWAGWGDHRHPIHFSGDAHTGWTSLAFQVPFTATAGNVGCFFWSHDIGGHFGPRIEEATARWVQFGALSAALRLHSARSGALDRRPWTYEAKYQRAMHGAMELRSRLMPYIYSAVRQCHAESLPLVRPMYLTWPDEPRAYRSPQQYMLGDHLLVAPIVTPGIGEGRVATQAVWFPPVGHPEETSQGWWYNWFTGERYAGGTEWLVAAAIDEIPLFVAGGVPVATRPVTTRMATEPLTRVMVRCFPGEAGTVRETTLYEDDGVTRDYERARFAVTPIRAEWSAAGGNGKQGRRTRLRLTIGPTAGAFEGQVMAREYVAELMGVALVMSERINGEPAPVEFDAQTRIARVRIAARTVREPVSVEMDFVEADHAAVRQSARERRMEDAKAGATEPADLAVVMAAGGTGVCEEEDGYRVYGAPSVGGAGSIALDVRVVDRVGAIEKSRSRHELRVRAGHGEWVATPRDELAAPPLGLVARREVRLATQADSGERVEWGVVMRRRTTPLTAWRVVGPFAFDPTKPIQGQRAGPELVGHGEHPHDFEGQEGRRLAWEHAKPGPWWPADMRVMYGSKNGAAMAYAATYVHSPREQLVKLLLECGDRIEAWLGADKVYTMAESVHNDSASDETAVTLREGWNRLMVKTSEGGGGWGVRIAIDGEAEVRELAEMK